MPWRRVMTRPPSKRRRSSSIKAAATVPSAAATVRVGIGTSSRSRPPHRVVQSLRTCWRQRFCPLGLLWAVGSSSVRQHGQPAHRLHVLRAAGGLRAAETHYLLPGLMLRAFSSHATSRMLTFADSGCRRARGQIRAKASAFCVTVRRRIAACLVDNLRSAVRLRAGQPERQTRNAPLCVRSDGRQVRR